MLTRAETVAWSLKVGYCTAKLKHIAYENASIINIYNFVFLEVSDNVSQVKLWKYQIFKNRQVGIPLMRCHTDSLWIIWIWHSLCSCQSFSHESPGITNSSFIFRCIHFLSFFNYQRIKKIALYIIARMSVAVTLESTISVIRSDLWALPLRGKNQSL